MSTGAKSDPTTRENIPSASYAGSKRDSAPSARRVDNNTVEWKQDCGATSRSWAEYPHETPLPWRDVDRESGTTAYAEGRTSRKVHVGPRKSPIGKKLKLKTSCVWFRRASALEPNTSLLPPSRSSRLAATVNLGYRPTQRGDATFDFSAKICAFAARIRSRNPEVSLRDFQPPTGIFGASPIWSSCTESRIDEGKEIRQATENRENPVSCPPGSTVLAFACGTAIWLPSPPSSTAFLNFAVRAAGEIPPADCTSEGAHELPHHAQDELPDSSQEKWSVADGRRTETQNRRHRRWQTQVLPGLDIGQVRVGACPGRYVFSLPRVKHARFRNIAFGRWLLAPRKQGEVLVTVSAEHDPLNCARESTVVRCLTSRSRGLSKNGKAREIALFGDDIDASKHFGRADRCGRAEARYGQE
ncbi:hypothetical protein B0H11DRAFT_1908816 [Mycena galericulata]|nr:hypothetical protein B0H11DRAFT_1908816 [Mycena galericulata]